MEISKSNWPRSWPGWTRWRICNYCRCKKIRDITPKTEIVKEFEIKTPDLRIYLIKDEGHIVIVGGRKNTQGDDIKKFRAIKRRYLQRKK